MTSPKAAADEAETAGTSSRKPVRDPLGFASLFLVSVWCGLVAGLLEVATIVIRKRLLFEARINSTG